MGLEAGLRGSEIKSLRRLSFTFENSPPTVRVEASDCKGKRTDDLVLMDTTADAIKNFLKDREPTDRAFKMPHDSDWAAMIRADLADAGIEYRDSAGRDADFHSTRHTFCTNLALAGVHPTVAQKLARHSSILTTMRYYTHVLHKSECEAIDALKNLTAAYPNREPKQDFNRRRWTEKVG
ncbi:MAG: site-specific integrase [Phycisphaerae bacterium]|nr:site-specific integrase [Phycisphaerae bacterium]